MHEQVVRFDFAVYGKTFNRNIVILVFSHFSDCKIFQFAKLLDEILM